MSLVQARRAAAATSLLRARRGSFRRTAHRFSLCADDADDALQRACMILLTKAPPHPPERLARWMHLVTKREALLLRRERERMLSAEFDEWRGGAVASAAEQAERREWTIERARALALLKPAERRALVLKGEGYSYREICVLTGWSYTKTNRCLAEGRATLRQLGAID